MHNEVQMTTNCFPPMLVGVVTCTKCMCGVQRSYNYIVHAQPGNEAALLYISIHSHIRIAHRSSWSIRISCTYISL